MEYKPTIGLEIHAELKTHSKMFCRSRNDPDEQHPNQNICSVCTAQPGALPVINLLAIQHVLKVGVALGGTLAEYSQFDRKNYFYPDLPKGYQISQYKHPLVSGGKIVLRSGKIVQITRVHLEEDTGKLVHAKDGSTLVDFNRAGVPLMELVTEPDIESASEAKEFAEELQLILRYVGVSDARMEMGEMRVEANVSLHLEDKPLGTKVELKNINSFRAVEKAIEFEIKRQTAVLEAGSKVVQETRGWDEAGQKTYSQRLKEEAHDYRYFPEPDLPPLRFNTSDGLNHDDIIHTLPELPREKRYRLKKEFQLDDKSVDMLVRDLSLSVYYEESISELDAWLNATENANQGEKFDRDEGRKLLQNYLFSDLAGLLREKSVMWNELLITPENFAELVKLIMCGDISSRGAKDMLNILVEEGGNPTNLMKERGFEQTSDTAVIEKAFKTVSSTHAKAIQDYRGGNANALQFLIGMTMKEVSQSGASANPDLVRSLIKDLLD